MMELRWDCDGTVIAMDKRCKGHGLGERPRGTQRGNRNCFDPPANDEWRVSVRVGDDLGGKGSNDVD